MPRTICVANQKGGVGKTTTSINLAAALAMAGQTTLLIDMDPQCNATSGIGCRPVDRHPLVMEEALRHWMAPAEVKGLFVLPGSRSFRDVDQLNQATAQDRLRVIDHLRSDTGRFDYVIIDSPPSLGPLTQTALAAADEILIPIQCEYFALEGLAQMIQVVRQVMVDRGTASPRALQFAGVLLTMYDHRLELTLEIDRQVREFFGEIVFFATIPRDVHLSESPSHGQCILDYAPRSRGCRAFVELCMEVLDAA